MEQLDSTPIAVIGNADGIHDMTDEGIRALAGSLKWGGAAFGYDGYSLEAVTGRKFIHGQAVGLGILVMSAMQDNEPEMIREVLDRIGIPYRPADMGITWDDVAAALKAMPQTIKDGKLWYTIASDHLASAEFTAAAREWIESDGGQFDRSSLSTLVRVS